MKPRSPFPKMNRSAAPFILSSLALVVLLLLGGCAGDDSAMAPTSNSGDPEFANVLEPRDASSGAMGGGGMPGFPIPNLIIEKELVNPRLGGVVTSGRYELTVPPGALPYAAEFEIKHFHTGPVIFELFPHGAVFDVPVTIEVDFKGTTLEGCENVTLYWWDERNRQWVDVGGDWDRETSILVTTLEHFSRYGGGRGGW